MEALGNKTDMGRLDYDKANSVTLTEVINWAARERWDEVDAVLPIVSQKMEFFNWAGANLKCLDLNLRDLATSILQHTDLDTDDPKLFSDEIVKDLFGVMGDAGANGQNPYPAFRAACALAKRREDERIASKVGAIRVKLQEFEEDEDVAEIAKDYLEKLAIN